MQKTGDAKLLPRRFFGCDSSQRKAFSLVELLVVVASTLTLASFFMPTFVGAAEKTRRATCRDHLRQFLVGVQAYANDNFARLPSGRLESNDRRDECVTVIAAGTRDTLLQYTGNARLLACPNLTRPFDRPQGWRFHEHGIALGYNYLGGHSGTPWTATGGCTNWVSPQTEHDDGALTLITDINDWSPASGKAFATHSNRGLVIKNDDADNGAVYTTSRDIGAAGGNIGLLDGSVAWKSIRQMQNFDGSRFWGYSGCLAAW
ncbi:MAG TPA: hypothetical protein VN281_06075 [Verrucomicrobiae bacterium]|nr:hypothetical protein [Verrucomicrobiae bacterium]